MPTTAAPHAFPTAQDEKQSNEQSIIIEVSENPYEIKEKINKDFPRIEVVAVYDQLLQGLALKATTQEFTKLARLHAIEGMYPSQTYLTTNKSAWQIRQASRRIHIDKPSPQVKQRTGQQIYDEHALRKLENNSLIFPANLNDTNYSGKGVKIGIIDTGLDFTHPDLRKNYSGGFDLVDLDDQPMETTEEEGVPTLHGTHVAGIIGANGHIKGVAPEAELYAYRALGPGGVGSSIQVIAALEEALKDDVDIINLSLGNTVNAPDYPTSKAVAAAAKHGIAIVAANGNAGPDNWTIGAPATAKAAFSVGAYTPFVEKIFLVDPETKERFRLHQLPFGPAWDLSRDYKLTTYNEGNRFTGKIVLLRQADEDFFQQIELVKEGGAKAIVIEQMEKKSGETGEEIYLEDMDIPIALLAAEDGKSLRKIAADKYLTTKIETDEQVVAPFSSRGPVTVNWQIKPNIIAPGVDVLSTIPNGYTALNGTSMAAPHITGVIALLKEARPDWTNEQIFAALETTAEKISDGKGTLLAPYIQGSGLVQPSAALAADVLVENGLLTFGRINNYIARTTSEITIHNLSKEPQEVKFDLPKKTVGLHWQVPKTFTLKPEERKRVPLTLTVNDLFLQTGLYDNWITVHIGQERVQLPYVFVDREDTYKKVDGFSIHLHPLNNKYYTYELYAMEEAKSLEVHLYDPESLIYVDTLVERKNLSAGMHEGKIKRSDIKEKGMFYSLLIVQLANGEIVNYERPIYLP